MGLHCNSALNSGPFIGRISFFRAIGPNRDDLEAIAVELMLPGVVMRYLFGGGGEAGADELPGHATEVLHRLKGNAAAFRAGRRDRHRLGSRRDGAARRAKPTAAAHAILWPHDLVGWPKALDNVSLGFHGPQDVVETSGERHQPSRSIASMNRHH